MKTQRDKFLLPDDVHYINCAYMSPNLKAAEKAGMEGIKVKRNPGEVSPNDFFDRAEIVKALFGKIINAKTKDIALIPSTSYGLQNAISNIIPNKGQHAVTISEEFPSGYFTLIRWGEKHHCPVNVISVDSHDGKRGRIWNEKILASITNDTAMLVMSSIHWTDGTYFNLKAIGDRCRETGTAFIVDGTQSVGAVPMDVEDFQIDALICASYKWLLCPYSTGVAYYGERFKKGIPIEESWMNCTNAVDFANLTDYDQVYKTGAGRYNVGEFSNFLSLPMMEVAFRQILEWHVANIESYGESITEPLISFLRSNGFHLEEDAYRSKHLFGFKVPENLNKLQLLENLKSHKIYLSLRKDSIRVSPHLYNYPEEIDILISILDNEMYR